MITALQYAALGQIFILLLIISRDLHQLRIGKVLIILIVGAAAYIICSDKNLLAQTGVFQYVLALGSFTVPITLWLTALYLFDDEFQLGVLHLVAMIALTAVAYWNGLAGDFFSQALFESEALDYTRALQQIMNMGFLIHALWITQRGHSDDLISQRRDLRKFIIGLGTATALLIALIEISLSAQQATLLHSYIGPIGIFIFSALLAYWLLNSQQVEVIKQLSQTVVVNATVSGTEDKLHQDLVAALTQEHRYREHALTINDLAQHLAVAEHQLRKHINQTLGFKNFSSFINAHRLKEVEAVFNDPSQRKTPILTIALTAGFQSITTFNRSFRQHYGTTPSEYRKQILSNS